MLRAALPLSVAVLTLLGSAQASAATQTLTPVRGEVRALAFGGDGVVVARRPPGRGLVFERIVPGSPAQALLSTALDDNEDEFSLAASAQATAIGLNPKGEDLGPTRVMTGPPAGPLREVAACGTGLVLPPVAVAGARIAWLDGGCGARVEGGGLRVGPAEIAIGGADPAEPVSRTAVGGEDLPRSLVLAPGDTGLFGTARPSSRVVASEVRPFGPTGTGPAVAAQDGAFLAPAGILGDGTRVFARSKADTRTDQDCATDVFTIAPGSVERRTVALGGCALSEYFPGEPTGIGPRVTADSVVALVYVSPAPRDRLREAITIVSARSDGLERRVLVRGTYRTPRGIAADGDRLAWWQPGCAGGSEIIVLDGPQAGPVPVTSCRAEILTRSARVRDGRIAIRVRCRGGCMGIAATGRARQRFTLGPGTHALGLPVALGGRRRARVRIRLSVEYAAAQSATIRVRR